MEEMLVDKDITMDDAPAVSGPAEEDVSAKKSPAAPQFDQIKGLPSQRFRHLRELLCKKEPEESVNTGACIEIPFSSYLLPCGAIVTKPGMIEAPVHELSEGNRSPLPEMIENKRTQSLFLPLTVFNH